MVLLAVALVLGRVLPALAARGVLTVELVVPVAVGVGAVVLPLRQSHPPRRSGTASCVPVVLQFVAVALPVCVVLVALLAVQAALVVQAEPVVVEVFLVVQFAVVLGRARAAVDVVPVKDWALLGAVVSLVLVVVDLVV